MKTYVDQNDFLTKVKCEYCKVGVPYQQVATLSVTDSSGVQTEYHGHDKCMETLQEQFE